MNALKEIYLYLILVVSLICFKRANGESHPLDDVIQDRIRRSRLHVDQEMENEITLGDRLFLPSQKDQALKYIEQLESVDLSKRYRNRHKIGKGGYGKVFKAKRDGKVYAVKTIELTKEVGNAVSVANEIIIMMNVPKSPNLVRAYNAFFIEEKGKIVIEMDYIKGMDMVDYVNEKHCGIPLGKRQITALSRDILNALRILHSLGIAHLDVKPENIMYDKITKSYRLIDYGLAGPINVAGHGRGTPRYLSPEMADAFLNNHEIIFSPSTDLYSLGSTLLRLYENYDIKHYLDSKDNDMYAIARHIFTVGIRPSKHREYSPKLRKFIKKLLSMDPNERASVDVFLNHPLIAPKKPTNPDSLFNKFLARVPFIN